MKIFLDFGHPAHVHYFRNFMAEAKKSGNEVIVTARDKEVTLNLLDAYKISYINRGKGKNSMLGKLAYLISSNFKILQIALKEKPDVFISASGIYLLLAKILLRKPLIILDDTEISHWDHIIYKKFADRIITPISFRKDLGKKHIKLNTFLEHTYLKKEMETKEDDKILLENNIKKPFILIRFISWNANHDLGAKGILEEEKENLIKRLEKFAKVYISSEKDLPESFAKYKLSVPPHQIHEVLAQAELFYTESGTMAAEAALLGTPTVYVSTLAKELGNMEDLQNKYQLLFYYDDNDNGLQKAEELLNSSNLKSDWQLKAKEVRHSFDNITDYLQQSIKEFS